MKDRWQALWVDQRRFGARWRLALPAVLAAAFTLLIFGPLDIFIQNRLSIAFPFTAVAGTLLGAGLACLVLLSGLLPVLRGKVFDVALSLLCGVTVAAYLQGNFWNLPLGDLNGEPIVWTKYLGHALKNLAMWAAVVCLPLLLRYLHAKAWRAAVRFVPLLLVGMQLTALTAELLTTSVLKTRFSAYYVSMDGAYELSAHNNVIVFLLDKLDGNIIRNITIDTPNFFEPLDGFTNYPNNVALYKRTFPSVASMLTGKLWDYKMPRADYLSAAWREEQLLATLRAEGYGTKVYIGERTGYWDPIDLLDKADNLRQTQTPPHVNRPKALSAFWTLSLYRYSPHVMKATLRQSWDVLESVVRREAGANPYDLSNYAFYRGLMSQRLSVQSEANQFLFYHLLGAHDPYEIDAQIRPVSDAEGTTDGQTRGCFEIIYEYIRQLKALGLYENATIIITGDHGYDEANPDGRLGSAKVTGLLFKPRGSVGTPLATSLAPLSHAYFGASILRDQGIVGPDLGVAYQDIDEQTQLVRKHYFSVHAGAKEVALEEFEILGDARDFSNWHKVKEEALPPAR